MNDLPSTARGRQRGFTYVEALIALTVLLVVMAMAFTFFADFGTAMNTESTRLATQQAARTVLDEISRSARQIGWGIQRRDSTNPAMWQRGVVHGGSHVLAFNADIDPAIGALPGSQTVSFPGGTSYVGEGIAALTYGAETYVYTLDANGDGSITAADRSAAETGSFNPAMDTPTPLDFALFRRIHGYNGTDYGGTLEPLAANLFTNATTDIQYGDGTTPEPFFTYRITEDLNLDGLLQSGECVDDVVDTCPPSTSRAPRFYIWGDTNFDGALSESEKTALRTMPVASTSWSKNRLVESGSYKSTTLAAAIDPGDPMAYEIRVNNANKIGPGYLVQVDTGSNAELLTIDQISTSSSPHTATLTSVPAKAHAVGVTVTVLPSTLLRGIRSIGFAYGAIADHVESQGGTVVAGRAGGRGTRGLDYRVTLFRREVEVVNAPTVALTDDGSSDADDVCPLEIVNQCSGSASVTSHRYVGFGGASDLAFRVTDSMGNPIAGKTVTFTNTKPLIGTLGSASATTGSDGVASVSYATSGTLGTDTVTAEVSCVNDSGGTMSYSATNQINVLQVQVAVASDCAGTVSAATPLPSTAFTVQINGGSSPVSGHELALGLAFDASYLPPSPDFTKLVGALSIAGGGSGDTGSTGLLAPLSMTTDGSGQIVGQVSLQTDTLATGARLNLVTNAAAGTCSSGGSKTTKVDFFKLALDSTVPIAGCTETAPCTIAANSTPPKARATLSIAGSAVSGANLTFSRSDLSPPLGATSRISPATTTTTDVAGQANVTVANNGAATITPMTPLRTVVDVSSTGPPPMCAAGVITNASPKVRFDMQGPIGTCTTSMLQAWVSKVDNKKICVHVKNAGAVGACPVTMTGIKVSVFDATGAALDGTVRYAQILGGAVTGSTTCSSSGSVTLFKNDCQSPSAQLSNGQQWNYNTFGSCSLPSSSVDPAQYFTIHRIDFASNFPVGRRMDIAVSFECEGECDTNTIDTQTFTLTTP